MIYFGTVVHVNDKKSICFMKAGGGGRGGAGGVIILELY